MHSACGSHRGALCSCRPRALPRRQTTTCASCTQPPYASRRRSALVTVLDSEQRAHVLIRRTRALLHLLHGLSLIVVSGCRVERDSPDDVDYRRDVQPLLAARCAGCHGETRAEAGFRADHYLGVIGCVEGSVPVTLPGSDGRVPLLAVLDRDDHRQILDTSERALVARWLDRGAPAGRGVHESAFLDPRSPDSHGAWLRAQRYRPLLAANDSMQCARCHAGAGTTDPLVTAPGATSCQSCHQQGVFACGTCHGLGESAAPPRDRCFFPTDRAGAHAAHGAPRIAAAIPCASCHPVPSAAGVFDGAHADGRVEVWFDRNVIPYGQRDPSSGRCVDTCHARGGARPDPRWYEEAPMTCGDCHGAPPRDHYVGACSSCHAEATATGTALRATRLHMNGVVDRGDGSGTCSACHGSAGTAWPSTGAHRAHATPSASAAVPCETCHVVPGARDPHPRGGAVQVRFSGLALQASRRPSYDASDKSCAGTYCHEGRGAATPAPRWDQGASGSACGSCHAVPPPAPHTASASCAGAGAGCHVGSTDVTGALTPAGASRHVDGRIDRGP